MPSYADFSIARGDDGTLQVAMTPPTAIGGWGLSFFVTKRLGGLSGLISKGWDSGIANGASGITIVNSGQGVFNVGLAAADTSGLDPGPYAYQVQRTSSGSVTLLSQGFLLVNV